MIPIDFQKLHSESNFREWLWNKATDEEKNLYELISQYSYDYFSDFRFEQGTIVTDFVDAKIQSEDSETWDPYCLEPPDILQYFDNIVLQSFKYKVEPIDDGAVGMVSYKNFTVTIAPGEFNTESNKPTILHELIHLYEAALESLPKFYHDILLLCLYNDLKAKIKDINDRITAHTNLYCGEQITIMGGEHDILFLLKSFDLDLKCNYKIGTVCGYGRDEDYID